MKYRSEKCANEERGTMVVSLVRDDTFKTLIRPFPGTTYVCNFDTCNVTNMNGMFFGCNSIKSLDLSNFNTCKVTNMNSLFSGNPRSHLGCLSLEEIKGLDKFDTSNVTDMSGMFEYCLSLIELDLSNFDTSNVTDMSYMFFKCESLTNLDLSNFDASNVTNMGSMFLYCFSLVEIIGIENFNTMNVKKMTRMFLGCASLKRLDLSKWNTSNVEDMSYMFGGDLTGLEIIPDGDGIYQSVRMELGDIPSLDELIYLNVSSFDTSKVTDMSNMFCCPSITELDVSNFVTSQVTDMSFMFFGCESLTNLDLSSFDTSKVTNMGSMFYKCPAVKSLDDIPNFDFTNVTDKDRIFG